MSKNDMSEKIEALMNEELPATVGEFRARARARRPKTPEELRDQIDLMWEMMFRERLMRAEMAKEGDKLSKNLAKLERTVRGVRKRTGDYSENSGRILERAVLARLRRDGGIGPVKGKVLGPLKNEGEYDGAVVNGEDAVVVEVKRNLRLSDVEDFAERRLPRFAQDFPGWAAGRNLYGALAFQLDADDGQALALARARGLMLLRVGDKKELTVLNPDPGEWRALAG